MDPFTGFLTAVLFVTYFAKYAPVATAITAAGGAASFAAATGTVLAIDAHRSPNARERQLLEEERQFKIQQSRILDQAQDEARVLLARQAEKDRQRLVDSRRDKAEQVLVLDEARAAMDQRLRSPSRGPRVCAVCGESIEHRRSNAKYCGDQCRQRSRRGAK